MRASQFVAKAELSPQAFEYPFVRVKLDAAASAQRIYAMRRKRDRVLNDFADLFHDPVWDVVLDLFVAAKLQSQISVSSACIAASVPSTTALRMLAILEKRGVVATQPDPFDKRRRFVSLTDTAMAKMEELFLGEDWAQYGYVVGPDMT